MNTLFTFLILFLAPIAFSQVGINTTSPSQTLDVNGQIQISGDSNLPIEEGVIRYNSANLDFEGFNGGQWNSLTQQAPAQIIPDNAVPIVGLGFFSNIGSGIDLIEFRHAQIGGTGVGLQTPPAGKLYVITSMHVNRTALTDGGLNVSVGPSYSSSTGPNVARRIFVTLDSDKDYYTYDSNVPMFVINNGRYITASNNAGRCSISLRGWMIDE